MTGPWATAGLWLKCALHAHTTRSDGELSPRDAVKSGRVRLQGDGAAFERCFLVFTFAPRSAAAA